MCGWTGVFRVVFHGNRLLGQGRVALLHDAEVQGAGLHGQGGQLLFNDQAAGSTFAADIAYVSQKGLMSGVGEGRFNPGAPVTRGQLVTIVLPPAGRDVWVRRLTS